MNKSALWCAIAAFSCGIDVNQTQDAQLEFGIHDQTAHCDPAWSIGASPICEYACAVKPAPSPCGPDDEVCYDRPACQSATAPNAPGTRSCAATFFFDGTRGCCDLLYVRSIALPIPTFFECD